MLTAWLTNRKGVCVWRGVVIWGAIFALISMLDLNVSAQTKNLAQSYDFQIEADTLGEALDAIVEETRLPILFPFEYASQTGINPVTGRYTVEEALSELLRGTDFSGGLTEKGVMYISFSGRKQTEHPERDEMKQNNQTDQQVSPKKYLRKTLFGTVAAALVGTGGAQAEEADFDKEQRQDVIVVTAQKREQSIQEVPASVSVFGNDELYRRGASDLQDLLPGVPGVAIQDLGPGQNKIVIRGIASSNFEQSSVGAYFGEVPLVSYFPSSNAVGAMSDIKMVDIERVEILRGPQGTLYGSGSMTGTIRYIPRKPDFTKFGGEIEVGYSQTARAGGENTKINGVLNIPLVKDKLALRLVGYDFDNEGYIKQRTASNPVSSGAADLLGAIAADKDNVAGSSRRGGRAVLSWQVSDKLIISATALTQEVYQDGWLESIDYQSLPVSLEPFDGRGEFKSDQVDIYNTEISYDAGFGTFTSSTSWVDGRSQRAFDFSRLFSVDTPAAFPAGLRDDWQRDGIFHETRFTSEWNAPLQITAGVYYEDQEGRRLADVGWVGDASLCCGFLGAGLVDGIFILDDIQNVEQLAIFGEASYDLTDKLEVAFGGRHFDYEQSLETDRDGSLNGGASQSRGSEEHNGENFKASLKYELTSNINLYSQWAQGFRLNTATPNIPPAVCDVDNDGLLDGTSVPINAKAGPDTLNNYEIGAKATGLDGRLAVNAAVYNIVWKDLPTAVLGTCGFGVTATAGEAISTGFELETQFALTNALSLNLSTSFADARITEEVPGVASKGDQLPNAPRWNVYAGIQYEFNQAENPIFLRADYKYVGKYKTTINSPFIAGDFHSFDLRVGIDIDHVAISAYVKNLTNSDGAIVNDGLGTDYFRTIQQTPRQIGVDLSYAF